MSDKQIKTKEDLLRLVYFYYDAFVLKLEKRHMRDSEKELISNMRFNDLLKLCQAEGIKALKSELKDNKAIWENVWDA